MTESSSSIKLLFTRQGILGGTKVPFVWGNPDNGIYNNTGFIFSGMWGAGTVGIPKTSSIAELDKIPYAARYVECTSSTQAVCRKVGYNGVCWIDRPDVVPEKKQGAMSGRAKW